MKKDLTAQKIIFCLDAAEEGDLAFGILQKVGLWTFQCACACAFQTTLKIFKGVVQFSVAVLIKQTAIKSEVIALRYDVLISIPCNRGKEKIAHLKIVTEKPETYTVPEIGGQRG